MRATSNYNLSKLYPVLAEEWHPIKNKDLTPFAVAPGSNKKVWWKCDQGHEWKAIISNRKRGSGCPYCAGQRVTEDNNLALKYPNLVKEWHPTKNGKLTPYAVMPKSNKKVWWRCSQDHEWKTSVSHRTGGTGCPKCAYKKGAEKSRRTIVEKRGSLADNYPQIVREWHPTNNDELKPNGVPSGSTEKVWWRCNLGHEWEARIYARTKGSGCPYCAGKRPTKENNLLNKHPHVAKEWHPTKNKDLAPNQVTPFSHRKVWWICSRGHEWEAQIAKRAIGRGCPFCNPQTSKLEIRFYCELKHIFDDVKWKEKIANSESDIYMPRYKVGIEIDGYPWHEDHEERDKQKGKQFLESGVKIFRVRDERLKQITQTDIFYKERESHLTIIMRLLKNVMTNILFSEEDRSRISTYFELNQLQNTREYRKIIAHLPSPPLEKSLTQLYPRLVMEWNYEKNIPFTPEMFTPGSGMKVWWICNLGHEWEATIYNRSGGRNCPYCSGKKVGRENNLAVKYPDFIKEWHPTKNKDLAPNQVTPFSGRKVWWICNLGHEWEARIYNRSYGTGCPTCYEKNRGNFIRKAALRKSGSLAAQYPELVKEWHPTKNALTPSDVTPGSNNKVWWICSQGHELELSVYNRIRRKRSCKKCYHEDRRSK